MSWARMYEKFEQLGGPEIRKIAQDFWEQMSPATIGPYMTRAMPLYTRTPRDPDIQARTIMSMEVLFDFARGEQRRMDLFPLLPQIVAPTLVLGGEEDPVCPIEDQVAIAAALAPGVGRLERFAGCGHGVFRDDPTRAFALIREFIGA
jgi:proline iminopeptidase